ncbi:MAG: TIGR02646 family protein, partial [Methylovulum sp.]|nr:TIGR02646 family protein [Methylovulum sp.]
MRKLDRPESPDCLASHAEQWTQEYLAARAKNPKQPFRWRKPECYQAIRESLRAMTQGHCAFCDAVLGISSRETVEHFRPKSQFPDLAYDWWNLFPCCDLCQAQKLEKFAEELLKPDADDFAFSRYFIANCKTGELEPSPQAEPACRQRAAITIDLYGLNLPARITARKREWEHYHRDRNSEPFL